MDISEEEYEKGFRANSNFSYSNGILVASPKQGTYQKIRVSLDNIRTTNAIEEAEKYEYECAAEVTMETVNNRGELKIVMSNEQVTYTSELADNGTKNFVSVKIFPTGSF